MSHRQIILETTSAYLDRSCPVTRQHLRLGEPIVVCQQNDVALREKVFTEQNPTSQVCPICNQAIFIKAAVMPRPTYQPAVKPKPFKSIANRLQSRSSQRKAIFTNYALLLFFGSLMIIGLLLIVRLGGAQDQTFSILPSQTQIPSVTPIATLVVTTPTITLAPSQN